MPLQIPITGGGKNPSSIVLNKNSWVHYTNISKNYITNIYKLFL